MPDEKNEKKATPFFSSNNNEGKKKESFTFSDKIKNSKQAPSKSFANRISSRVGSDGKPRQTLFERTKRDAPFFIAALVALLLLPFLYKYSGNVDEEPELVTPSYEDSAFNPERSGFMGEFTGNPDEQIAQLSGRDLFGLITPLGGKQETEETEEDDSLRHGFAGEGSSASHKVDEYDEENNITNRYRYRKKAPAQVRAAIKRNPTKINRLGGATRAGASGNKLGIGMWGGNLKSAANKVKGPSQSSAPKPVSLQPLKSAGKPSRSYFGQGAAAEARRSKDAMSKANAMQALMDAQMKPVDTGKLGGLTGGLDGAPGGGRGNIGREFVYNGKEPWWWDLMKQKEMMKWQKLFEFKWSLINWATDLLKNILGGVLNCLFTGTDDGSMGKMGGAVAGAGKADECNGMTAEDWDACSDCKKLGAMTEANCRTKFGYIKGSDGVDPWKGGTAAKANLNFWQSRKDCLTNGRGALAAAKKAGEGIPEEKSKCTEFYQTGVYQPSVKGEYTLYTYVVGVPFDQVQNYYNSSTPDERMGMLQVAYFRRGGGLVVDSNEVQQEMNKRKFMPLFVESVAIKNKKTNKKTAGKDTYDFEKPDESEDAVLSGLVYTEEEAKEANKNKQAGTRDVKAGELKTGLLYTELIEKLRGDGIVITHDGEQELSAKGSKGGKDWNTGARCAYPMAFIACHNGAVYKNGEVQDGDIINGSPAAFLKIPNLTSTSGKASESALEAAKRRFNVTYEIQGENQNAATGVSTSTDKSTGRLYYANIHESAKDYNNPNVEQDGGTKMKATEDTYIVKVEGKALNELTNLVGKKNEQEKRAVVTWTVRQMYNDAEPWAEGVAISDGKAVADTASSPKPDGEGSGARPGGQIVSQATCVYYDGEPITSTVPYVPQNPCPKGENTNEECCLKAHPNGGYEFKNGKCAPKPVEPTGKQTCLAKLLVWVPATYDERNEVNKDNQCGEKTFPGTKIITGTTEDHCSADMGIEMIESQETTAFVKRVVDQYNEKHKEQPITFDASGYPTMGEFVDALQIASKMGIELANAPKEGVCLMARHVSRRSLDPHTTGQTWTNDGQTEKFHNELGSYLAYVHDESVYYPSTFYGREGNCDNRFISLSIYTDTAKKNICKNNTQIPGDAKERLKWYFGHYAWKGEEDAYKASLDKLGIAAKNYPLAALAEGKTVRNEKCGNYRCMKRRKAYANTFGNLLQGNCPTGNMNVEDALRYITSVCEIGLNAKPWGKPGNGKIIHEIYSDPFTVDPNVGKK